MSDLYSQVLAPMAAQRPSATALVSHDEGGQALSFRELKRLADSIALGLERAGVGPGARVAVAAPNCIGFAAAVFAVAHVGAALVPVAPLLRPPEVAKLLADSRPQLFLLSHRLPVEARAGFSAAAQGVRKALLADGSVEDVSSEPVRGDALNPPGTAAVLYTSGTTGLPKGVVLTTENLVSNARASAEVLSRLGPGQDVFTSILPFFHSFGLTTGLLLPLLAGGCALLFTSFSPRAFLRGAAQHKAAIMLLVPEMYRTLTAVAAAGTAGEAPLPALRACVSGGAALPPQTARQFEGAFRVPIHQGYGVTETSPVLSISNLLEPPIPECSGEPIPGVELAIVDADGNELPAGADGEIAAAGPNVAAGYFEREELTAQRFRTLSLSGRPPKRYYLTGDVGHLDERGRIYVRGRMDDMIVVNGLNVYPSEIANALGQFPGCVEVVVGRVRSEVHGQEPVALMVLSEGSAATEEQVKAFAAARLAPHKVPAQVLFVPEILKNPLQKPLPRQMLLGMGLPAC